MVQQNSKLQRECKSKQSKAVRAMCSHESITWQITDNCVTDRMIDNSLIHKFKSSRKVRRRTKVLNTAIKNRRKVEDYKHYVELKTNVIHKLVNNSDTSDSSSLTDVDYDIIYSCPSKRAKYVTKNFRKYNFINEEDSYQDCRRETAERKKKDKSRSAERRTQTRKSPRLNTVVFETGWQEVIKKSNNVSHLHKSIRTSILNNERNILEDNDCLKVQSSKQSPFPQIQSQNNMTSSVLKSGNKYKKQNHEDSDATDSELNSKNNMTSNESKSVSKRRGQNQKNQNEITNESNTEFNSHYQLSSSQATSLENSNDSDNKLNSLVKSNDNSNKSTTVNNKYPTNTKNCDKTYVSCKPRLLRNVKRNLTPALEKADSINNKDIETNKSVEDETSLNYDQLFPDIAKFDRHSTPLTKTQTNISKMKNLSPDTSLQDQQKDSGIDEDSEDRFIKIKRSDKIPTSQDAEENAKKIISSPKLRKMDEIVEDCEEVVKDTQLKFNNILGRQISEGHKPSGEEKIKNSLHLNQIDLNVETNQGDREDECFVKSKDSSDIEKQQLLSPKQNCIKEVHLEPCNQEPLIREEKNKTVKKSAEKEEIFLQLNKEDKAEVYAEVSSITHEGKQDSKEEKFSEEEMKTDNVTEICSTSHADQTQLSSPMENNMEDVHPQPYNNISNKNKQTNEEKEGNNSHQLNQVDNDTKMHLISKEDKTCMELEDTHDLQKQQTSLPKIMCTEILNKKYKIIDKIDNAENNIKKIDEINKTDVDNEYNPIKKNTLIHCPDVINHNTDNWQVATVNEKEIDTPMTLETDNEENNVNYMSPQTKKRLQQQARLNLVVISDSSDSDETIKTSQKHINSLDTNHCSEDNRFKNDEINCVSKQTYISCSEDICIRKETTSVKEVKLDLTNMKEEIKKKESLTGCTYENNDLLQSATNKNLLQETQNCENDDQSQKSSTESLQLEVFESNISSKNEESINQFQRHKQSFLDKENMHTKSNQNEKTTNAKLETKHQFEQSAQASTKSSNVHLSVSYQSRPRNLQQLVEDQELFVETMPASFTLADLSEDEEAFILNVPSKVVQSNLQGQLLRIKDKSIKFNESKYRIVCKEVGTTSCIFATGKEQKSYKIINMKKISTITVREKLPQDSIKSNVLNSCNTAFSVPKSIKKNQQTDSERGSKVMKNSEAQTKKFRYQLLS